MKYIKLTLEYLFKNFWYVLLLSIVPGVLLGIFTNPTSMFNYIAEIGGRADVSFAQIFAHTSELTWISLAVGIAIFPVVVVFISALCGIESKHMRLGIKNINAFFKRVNNNILYVGLVALALILMLEIVGILFTSFAFLWAKVFHSATLIIVFNIVTAATLILLLLLFFSWCILWLPTMTITGLSPKKAIGQTMVNVRGKKMFKIFLSVVVPLIPIFAVSIVLSYFKVKFRFIFGIVSNTFMIMYYVTLMYTSYCELCDIDREDKKNIFEIKESDNKEE